MTQPTPARSRAAGSPLLRRRLVQRGRELSRTERLIAEHLAQVPVTELPFLNAEQIATATGTSDASVIRTARSLGFSGLPELKRHATRPHAEAPGSGERLARRLDVVGEGAAASIPTFFAAAREILDESEQELSAEELATATAVVAAAHTVWAVGIGTAGSAAMHLADTLARTGVRTRWTRATGFDLANELVNVRAGDVIVLFHAASPLPDVARLVEHAHEVGVPVVLVSGTQLADTYAPRVAATLRCVGTASRLATWTFGAHAVAELLSLSVAAHDPTLARQTHVRLAGLRAALSGEGDGEAALGR